MNWKRLGQGKGFLIVAALLLLLACFLGMAGERESVAMSDEEKRIAEVLGSITGAGKVKVALYYPQASGGFSAAQTPVGAVVVAEGAESMEVRLNLIRAARTLLGLPETAVDVFLMEAE